MDQVAAEQAAIHSVPVAATRRRWPLLPGLALLVLALGFLVGTFMQPALPQSGPTTDLASPAISPLQTVLERTHYFLGDPQAPVTIIVFSDYQCGYCATLALDTLRQLESTYVQNGRVRIGMYPVAYLGAESRVAAEASACADELGDFWAFHDLLLQQQATPFQAGAYTAKLQQLAQRAGLDATQFATCVDSGRYAQRVQEDNAIAQQLGVHGTPTTFINGQVLVGAQPLAAFQRAIDAAQ